MIQYKLNAFAGDNLKVRKIFLETKLIAKD